MGMMKILGKAPAFSFDDRRAPMETTENESIQPDERLQNENGHPRTMKDALNDVIEEDPAFAWEKDIKEKMSSE